MTVFQKMMYVSASFAVALSVSMANYVFYDDRIPENKKTTGFYQDMQKQNDRILKYYFPYEEVNYELEVPSNMTYTQAEFQKFKGTYLTKRKQPVSQSYMKNIVFCGDSITYHMGMPGNPFENYDVLAWGGLTVSDYATHTQNPVYNHSDIKGKTTVQWLSEMKPDIIYLMLGANGIAIYNNTLHINLYNKLLDKIRAATPHTKIVIVTSPPWGTDQIYSSMTAHAINEKNDQFNMLLLETAKNRGCYFLNLAETLKDAGGNLKHEYSSGDGLHWSQSARHEYVNYLLSHPIPGY